MTTRSILFSFLVLGVVATGCEVEEGQGAVGIAASPLTGNCSGAFGKDPIGSIQKVELLVTGPSRGGLDVLLASGSSEVRAGSAELSLGGIPVGLDNVVTLLGYASGQDSPTWYGRRREVSVLQDRTTEVELALTRLDKFTCITPPTSFRNRVFSSTVQLGDGRVLITGGLTTVRSVDGSTWELGTDDNSRAAFIYDPVKGRLTAAGEMTVARAGHSSVYLPLADGERVVIFGGTNKVRLKTDGSTPIAIDSADSLDSYEIYDIAKGIFVAAGDSQEGLPRKMVIPRAFFEAVRLFDNTVLITGGGAWPVDRSEYLMAEVFDPSLDSGRGAFLDLYTGFQGKSNLNVYRQHNGAAVAKLEDTSQGLSRYLVVGGTTWEDAKVEIYTQSSKQQEGVSGAFLPRTVGSLPYLFFPKVSPVREDADGSRRFLVTGGLEYTGGQVTGIARNAYLLKVDALDRVTAEAILRDSAPDELKACLARFMHSSTVSHDGLRVTLLGGFSNLSMNSNVPTCFIDLDRLKEGLDPVTVLDAGMEQFLSRGGHQAERLLDETILLIGGMAEPDTLSKQSTGMIEVYASPVIRPDLSM